MYGYTNYVGFVHIFKQLLQRKYQYLIILNHQDTWKIIQISHNTSQKLGKSPSTARIRWFSVKFMIKSLLLSLLLILKWLRDGRNSINWYSNVNYMYYPPILVTDWLISSPQPLGSAISVIKTCMVMSMQDQYIFLNGYCNENISI